MNKGTPKTSSNESEEERCVAVCDGLMKRRARDDGVYGVYCVKGPKRPQIRAAR